MVYRRRLKCLLASEERRRDAEKEWDRRLAYARHGGAVEQADG